MSARIVWAIVSGFLSGVFLNSLYPLPWPFAIFLAVIGACAVAYAAFDAGKRMQLSVAAIFLCACALGIARLDAARLSYDPALHALLGKTVVIEGVIDAEPDMREKSSRLSVRATSIIVGSSTRAVDAGVLVIAPPHASAAYGDVVRAKGKLRLPEAFDAGEGRSFNYPMFLAKDGILYELAFAEAETTGERHANPLVSAAIWIKQVYLSGLQAVLPEPEAGLAGGITVGDKRSIGSELSAVFRTASLVHIVVLSGYNITVVLNAAAELLAWIPRSLRLGASGLIVALFILMTGGAASAVRAGAMALLAIYARMTGRLFFVVRILGVVAASMVLWNPLILLYDPGFQLSILATLGLVLFTPIVAAHMSWLTERFGMREIAASTIGTQLMVLPLLLYQNGSLSLVALPANLLALTPVPFAMLFSFIAAICGAIFGGYATFVGLPAYVLLAYIIGVAQFFASLPFAAISIEAFSAWWLVVLYASLLLMYVYVQRKTLTDEP